MIFGTFSPKFVYDPSGTSVTVMMNYVVVLKDEPFVKVITNESIINGHREYHYRGKHWLYEVRIHIFKCSNPRSKYEEIKQYEGLEVALYRHRDAEPFKNSTGDIVPFVITSIKEAYWDTPDYKDVLIVTFQSKDYIDLSDGSPIVPQAEEIIMSDTISVDI